MPIIGKRRRLQYSMCESEEAKKKRVADDGPLSSPEVAVSKAGGSSGQDSKPLTPETISDSSATVCDDSVSVNKGKGKVVEPDPILAELESLREQVAAQAKVIKLKDHALERIEKEVSCAICMDMSSLPYILPACGHIYCHGCLVKWFTTPQAGEYIPEARESDGDDRNDSGTDQAPGVGPPPVMEPPAPVYSNVKNRVKVCPFCRAVVKERPTPLRSFVNIAAILRGEGETVASKYSTSDWKNIFRLGPSDKPRRGEPSATHPRGAAPDTPSSRGTPLGALGTVIEDDDADLMPSPIYDADDGVYRCGRCLHEVWGSRCSNEECEAYYEEFDDEGSDGSGDDSYDDPWERFWMHNVPDEVFEAEMGQYEGSFINDAEEDDSDDFMSGPPRRLTREMGLDHLGIDHLLVDSDPESDQEPSSRARNRFRPTVISSSSEEGSGHPAPSQNNGDRAPRSGRAYTSNQFSVAAEASGEDEADEPGPSHRYPQRRLGLSSDNVGSTNSGPRHTPRRGRRRIIIDDDDDDDEEESDRPVTNRSAGRLSLDNQEDSEESEPEVWTGRFRRRQPARFFSPNDIEEHNVEQSIYSAGDLSNSQSSYNGNMHGGRIEAYISDASNSQEEEEFHGFADYDLDPSHEDSDRRSDASAANRYDDEDSEEL